MNINVEIKPSEARVQVGKQVTLVAKVILKGGMTARDEDLTKDEFKFKWKIEGSDKVLEHRDSDKKWIVVWNTNDFESGTYAITVDLYQGDDLVDSDTCSISVEDKFAFNLATPRGNTNAESLNTAIRMCTNQISFDKYIDFINTALCIGFKVDELNDKKKNFINELRNEGLDIFNFKGIHSYEILKLATEVFLLLNSCCDMKKVFPEDISNKEKIKLQEEEQRRWGTEINLDKITKHLENYLGDPKRLPYIKLIVKNLSAKFSNMPFCNDDIVELRANPCFVELIWSYWHEEGMLTQTLNAISMRFQNRKTSLRDPLANLTIDPLRPLNNLLWGYLQDEIHRLSLQRRAYEYDNAYGLALIGKAVPALQTADSRSKFLEAFHSLLNSTMSFYKEESNKMIVPDAFPLLNALKEVHLLLAEGAHNQFGDLPWTARVEMLIEQWLLARPEMKEFLGRRPMMPYKEGWMAPVDAMKSMQGWTDVSVIQFRELGVFGEQIILSIRYGDWNNISDSEEARNWALYWKSEIQSYVHSYRAVTGVDLASPVTKGKVDATKPSILISRQLANVVSR